MLSLPLLATSCVRYFYRNFSGAFRYTIVHFKGDNTVAVAYTGWVRKTGGVYVCYWPRSGNRSELARKCTPVTTNFDCFELNGILYETGACEVCAILVSGSVTICAWRCYFMILILSTNSDDWQKAREKTKMAETQDDVNTTTNDEREPEPKKRKIQ